MFTRLALLTAVAVMLTGPTTHAADDAPNAYQQARSRTVTRLQEKWTMDEAPVSPPSSELDLVFYEGPLGPMAAYVSARPEGARRRPAIIWLVGGFSNSISDIAWTPGPRENDQSATGFRAQDIVMLYPSLRGGNTNAGHIEVALGEVDDVLAAATWLASLDYVDPKRIYLGGHSTGGTLALLVAETGTTRFRAVFSLGPADEVAGYGQDALPFNATDVRETYVRAPIRWLAGVRCPTYVFEGSSGQVSNIASLQALKRANKNALIQFHPIPGGDHFSIIAPLVENLATQITADTDAEPHFDFRRIADLMKSKR